MAMDAFGLDGKPLSVGFLKRQVGNGRQTFRANYSGMVYNVDRALRLVKRAPREFVLLPVGNHPLDLDLNMTTVMSRDTTKPGIILFYVHPTEGDQYLLIDGNHRVVKCALLEKQFFPAHPLTPDEARSCELYIMAATMPALPIEYRAFWESSKRKGSEHHVSETESGLRPVCPHAEDTHATGDAGLS